MVRLIYASRFEKGVGPNDVQRIVRVSEARNKEAGITGVLCHDPRFFLQVLEGPRDRVNELYTNIAGDKRHSDVMLLAYREVEERLFEGWSMAYVSMDETTRTIRENFCPLGTFDPYAMTEDEAIGFVAEISAERKRVLASLAT